MSVFKRETTRGETNFYHYRFMHNGKIYRGVCNDCTKKKDALEFEKTIKNKVNQFSQQKTVKALFDNFRKEITRSQDIFLSGAFELFLKKPRKSHLSEKQKKQKESYWRDFVEFMTSSYPDVKKMSDVLDKHAEEYIQNLRENGRFNKQVAFKSGNKTISYQGRKKLSNRTCNVFHITMREIFDKLGNDAGIIKNPFEKIPRLDDASENREAFTEKELKLIAEKADDFVKPIFAIGIYTALREGDICTLKWDEVDLDTNLLIRKMSKTNRTVKIPILDDFRNFLIEQKEKSGGSEYVIPEHAEMYQKNPGGISWRFKNFLESNGIKTTKKLPGRSRSVSIKDVHSLRHTFCYYAGISNIPLLIVKDIVGHMSEEMTELYQRHADNKVKMEKLQQMPDFMRIYKATQQVISPDALPTEPERAQLHQLVDEIPLDVVKELLKQLQIRNSNNTVRSKNFDTISGR
jgi:integrase